jgi:dTDP-glucose pyrophosphorylase
MSNWKDSLISPEASVEDAIKAIGAGAMRIALVVDANRRLLGTVTDGDVRRAIIRHVALDHPVRDIMNATPKTVPVGTGRDELLGILHAHSLLQVPIVDDEFRVVGIETLQDIGHTPQFNNWVFLMAGGFGKRLRPLTYDVPKPMLPVGGKPVLETIVESFIAHGFHRFYIAVHYKGEAIKEHFGNGERWDATIRYIDETTPLGTAGALSLLPSCDGLPVLMMNGDLLTKVHFQDLLRFHEQQGAVATLCGRRYNYQVPFGVIDAEGHVVHGIVEKPVHTCFVNAGIYVISPEAIAAVPKGESLDMPDLLQDFVDSKQKVCVFPIHEYWLDIGQMSDFERAGREFPGEP